MTLHPGGYVTTKDALKIRARALQAQYGVGYMVARFWCTELTDDEIKIAFEEGGLNLVNRIAAEIKREENPMNDKNSK
jgi:hypothetical protein